MTSSAPAIRSAISWACPASVRRRGRARARPPRGRCRRAGSRRRPGTPRPGRSASGRPARTARAGSRPAPRPGAGRRSPRPRANGSAQSSASRHEPDALAVVPAPRRLEHAREAERLDVGQRGRRARCAGTGRRARRAAPASRPCPGRAPAPPGRAGQRARRPRARAGARSGTCSWSKVTTAQPSVDLTQRVEVAVVADQLVGDHLRGRDALGLGEQPQREPERDRGLRHHPGQLAAADHGEGGGGRGHAVDASRTGGRGLLLRSPVSNRRPLPRMVVISRGRRLSSPSLRRTQPRWTSIVFDEVQNDGVPHVAHQLVTGHDVAGPRDQRVDQVELLAGQHDLPATSPRSAGLGIELDVLHLEHMQTVRIDSGN